MIVTDIELYLHTARALLPAKPEKAVIFVKRVVAETADPRLRFLVSRALLMIQEKDVEAAGRWLERALGYHQARRAR